MVDYAQAKAWGNQCKQGLVGQSALICTKSTITPSYSMNKVLYYVPCNYIIKCI